MIPLADATRGRIARTWLFRAGAERASAMRFRRLARELAEVHATPVVVEMADAATEDEVRHAQLCLELGRRYDGRAPAGRAHASGPVGDPRATPRDRVLYEVVSFCCVAETMNVAVLTESLRRSTDPEVRAAIHQILRDEVSHARLGWAHLASERALGGGGFLDRALARMVRSAHAEATLPSDAGEDLAAEEHGELSKTTARAILTATMRTVIFPGLVLHGIDVTEASRWLGGLEARASSPSSISCDIARDEA